MELKIAVLLLFLFTFGSAEELKVGHAAATAGRVLKHHKIDPEKYDIISIRWRSSLNIGKLARNNSLEPIAHATREQYDHLVKTYGSGPVWEVRFCEKGKFGLQEHGLGIFVFVFDHNKAALWNMLPQIDGPTNVDSKRANHSE